MTALRVLGVSFLNARPLVAPLREEASPLFEIAEALSPDQSVAPKPKPALGSSTPAIAR